MTNLRLIAAKVIDAVTDGQSLSDVLELQLKSIKEARDRAFVQAICFGVCRFYHRLDVLVSFLLKKPMKAKDSLIHALLLVGLYQLIYMRVPSHAAVKETVDAAKQLRVEWAAGFVNAILREYIRRHSTLEEKLNEDDEAFVSHPIWLIGKIKKAWPLQSETIFDANNQHPPMTLRVNQQKISVEDYLALLKEQNIEAEKAPFVMHGIILNQATAVESLPGFADGFVSIQDSGAQLAAEILNVSPNESVLDGCAAPGGKLLHLLEKEKTLRMLAIEKDEKRLQSIKENLSRLQQQATLICEDAADVDNWWDGKDFDHILLDAPCSATGVIRRHPDIKLLRQPNDIKQFSNEQLRLLNALWPVLKKNGQLLYVTCSILPEENSNVIQQFLATHPDAEEIKISAEWGIPCEFGRQILTGMHQMDGFYYALLRKK